MAEALIPADPPTTTHPAHLVRRAAGSSLDALFDARARAHPDRVAVEYGTSTLTYRTLQHRSQALAAVLVDHGVVHGSRVAVVAENRPEYLEIALAAGRLGAVTAAQNARATGAELAACLDLVEPQLTVCSPRMQDRFGDVLAARPETVLALGPRYEQLLGAADRRVGESAARPEDLLVIIYTSGTTGTPKGACISHRAEIARSMATRAEYGLAADDAFVAWSPLSHMGALDNSLGTLLSGGTVIVVDGFDAARLVEIVATRRIGWLLVMPGTTRRLADALRSRGAEPAGVRICGVMPDLIAPAEIAEITGLLGAPFANTFGSTETGCPPCSAGLIPIGRHPTGLAKEQSAFCEVRLVDPQEGTDVADGTPGEMCVRGPTLFSGYWNNPAATATDFRDGWFHMGDLLVRGPDGTLEFVDRVKYLIKSGGENIYPAEIERVLLAHPQVIEAAVVRRTDPTWGEVPVAFVATGPATLTVDQLSDLCRQSLPGYKRPREIRLVPPGSLPRNTTGKIIRRELEDLATSPSSGHGEFRCDLGAE